MHSQVKLGNEGEGVKLGNDGVGKFHFKERAQFYFLISDVRISIHNNFLANLRNFFEIQNFSYK